jgi:hypothetical protein
MFIDAARLTYQSKKHTYLEMFPQNNEPKPQKEAWCCSIRLLFAVSVR